MKLKIKKTIDLETLLMWVGLLCVVSYALLEHMSIPIPVFSAVKMPLLYAGGVCVIPLLSILFANIRKIRFFYVFLVLFALCASLLIGMKYNSDTVNGFSPEQNTIRLVLYLLELFVLMMAFAEKEKGRAAIKLVFYYVLVLVVLTDVFMFTGLFTYGTEEYPNYLVGTKFTVSYMHFNLFALWIMQQRDKKGTKPVKKWLIWGAAGIVALVAIYVNCMSGVLGIALLVWLTVWRSSSQRVSRLLTSPAFFVTCIVACTWIAFVIGFFLDIPFIKTFIEDVLCRSTTLTGRINIYLGYTDAMQGHWLFGYGYGSSNLVSHQFFGCANAQNAVLQWILQCGLVTTVLLIMLLVLIMKQVNMCRKDANVATEVLVVLVYTYIMLGIVEVTYSMSFILFLALIFMVTNDKKWNGLASDEQTTQEG